MFLLLACFAAVMSVYSFIYFSGRINTYLPVEVFTADTVISNVVVYGITPFGREMALMDNNDHKHFSSYYTFFKEFRINFSGDSGKSGHVFLLQTGNQKFTLTLTENERFRFPSNESSVKKYFSALFSVFHWTLVKNAVKFICFLMIALIIVLTIIKMIKSRWILRDKIRCIYRGCLNFTYNVIVKINRNIRQALVYLRKFISVIVNKISAGISKLMIVIKKNFWENFFPVFIFLLIIVVNILILLIISAFFNKPLLKIFENYNGLPLSLLFVLITSCIGLAMIWSAYKILRLKQKTILGVVLIQISVSATWMISEIILRFNSTLYTHNDRVGEHLYLSVYTLFTQNHYHHYNPGINFTLTTNEFSYLHRINSLGLRNDEIPKGGKLNNECRIVAIGDSFTEGVGASQDSTWPALLENKLNAGNHEMDFRVINAGISGSDPLFGYVLLKDKLMNFNPDVVLYTFNCSDIDDVVIRGGIERFIADGTTAFRKGPYWECLYAISYTARLIVNNLLNYTPLLISREKEAFLKNKSLASLYLCSRAFQELENAGNFKTVCIIHPYPNDFVSGKKFNLRPLLDSYGKHFPPATINLYNYFSDSVKMDSMNVYDYYWKNDRHHNGRGYNAFAEGVYRGLKYMVY